MASPAAPSTRLTDATGVTLSGLCLIHCLAVPLLAALLPALAPLTGARWLHWLFVGLALPIAGLMIRQTLPMPATRSIAIQGVFGICLLLAALVVPALEAHEGILTLFGGLILAGAHLRRWAGHDGTGH